MYSEELFNKAKNEFIRGERIEKYLNDKDKRNTFVGAVEIAFIDASFRTIKGHTSNNKSYLIQRIAKILEDGLNRDCDNLDIIKEVEELLRIDCGTSSFGKAQKIVNMSYKYLYCKEVDVKVDKRDIALDSRIIDFYNSFRGQTEKNYKKKKYVFSNLIESDYIDIQNNFKKEILPKLDLNGLSIFKAEFIIYSYASYELLKKAKESADKSFRAIDNEVFNECDDFIKTQYKINKEKLEREALYRKLANISGDFVITEDNLEKDILCIVSCRSNYPIYWIEDELLKRPYRNIYDSSIKHPDIKIEKLSELDD